MLVLGVEDNVGTSTVGEAFEDDFLALGDLQEGAKLYDSVLVG